MPRMMKRYPLELQDEQFVKMHWLGSATVSVRDDQIYLHAEVDTSVEPKNKMIYIVGDSQEVSSHAVRHLGSFHLRNSTWHVFV